MSKLSQRFRHQALGALILGAAGLLTAPACSPELSSISEIASLRIFGVRKSAPYAAPGETVELELLWDAGGEIDRTKVQRFFTFFCLNPLGDSFESCLAAPPAVPPAFGFNQDRFSIQIPPGAVQPPYPGGPAVPFGLAVVFYGICNGSLTLAGIPLIPDGSAGASGIGAGGPSGLAGSAGISGVGGALALPGSGGLGLAGAAALPASGGGAGIDLAEVAALPKCEGPDGEELGSDDFVIGYSQIFIYDQFRNNNPIITGFRVDGKDVTPDCVDEACVGEPLDPDTISGCGPGIVCFDACAEGQPCNAVPIQPVIDQSSAEPDLVSEASGESGLQEGLWVSYFYDRGSVTGALRLVNDAVTGWNGDYGTKFIPPAEPGPVRLWAVVRDNRGGMAWVRIPAYVRASDGAGGAGGP